MKIFSTLCCLIICQSISYIYAQITYTSTDVAQIGDVITRHVDTLASVTPGPSGANVAWTLTNATLRITETTQIVSPSATPYASSFSNSNIAMTNDNTNYLFFNKSTNDFIATGLAGDLLSTGSTIVAALNPTLTANVFPSTYGTTFQDNYGMDVTTSGSAFGVHSIRFRRIGVLSDTVDGWGNLTTPVGSYQALRLKHTDRTVDTTWIKLTSFTPWTVYEIKKDTTISYSWVAKNGKLAIAELAFDTLGQPKRFTWSTISPTTSLAGSSSEYHAQIYPNPANNHFEYQLPESINPSGILQIENNLGQVIQKELVNAHRGQVYLNKTHTGVYIIRFLMENGQQLQTHLIITNE